MTRRARLIGLEGRTDLNDLAVAEGAFIIRRPCFNSRIDKTEPDHWITRFDDIVYKFDFEAEDGTLIYRRITPPWRD